MKFLRRKKPTLRRKFSLDKEPTGDVMKFEVGEGLSSKQKKEAKKFVRRKIKPELPTAIKLGIEEATKRRQEKRLQKEGVMGFEVGRGLTPGQKDRVEKALEKISQAPPIPMRYRFSVLPEERKIYRQAKETEKDAKQIYEKMYPERAKWLRVALMIGSYNPKKIEKAVEEGHITAEEVKMFTPPRAEPVIGGMQLQFPAGKASSLISKAKGSGLIKKDLIQPARLTGAKKEAYRALTAEPSIKAKLDEIAKDPKVSEMKKVGEDIEKIIKPIKPEQSLIQEVKPSPPTLKRRKLTDLQAKAETEREREAMLQVETSLPAEEFPDFTPLEIAESEVFLELDVAEAGQRIMTRRGTPKEDTQFIGIPSTFPQWIPSNLRRKPLLDKVMEHMTEETAPTKGRVKELYDIVQEKIAEKAGVPLSEVAKKPTKITPEIEKRLRKRARDIIKKETIPPQGPTKGIIKEQIDPKSPLITKRETTLLKDRMRNYSRGVREGRIDIRKDAKTTVKQFENNLKQAGIPAKDYKKFVPKMREIATANDPIKKFHKEYPELERRIVESIESDAKRNIQAQIKKELKRTKPLKKGDKRIERYDYETNKHFIEVRNFDNLNQEEALSKLSKYEIKSTPEDPEPIMNEIDKIKARFLSLKANGANASVAIHEKVLEDIIRIKEIGERAKNLEDFEKQLQRQERVNEAIDALDKIKVGKEKKKNVGKLLDKAFENLLEKPYDRTIANTKSLLNSLMGSDFAEKYSPVLPSSRAETAVYHRGKRTNEQIAKALGTDLNGLNKKTLEMARETYPVITDTGRTIELNKLEIMDIYNSSKNEMIRERYDNWLGETQVNSLIGKLTQPEMRAADIDYEGIQEYYDVFNELNIERYGRDLGKVKSYWPATSEHQPGVLDEIKMQGETPSAIKQRAQSTKVIPRPVNSRIKALQHINQGEHVRHISRVYENLKRIFTDRNVKDKIIDNYGEEMYKDLMKHLERLSLNYKTEQLNSIDGIGNTLLNGWTVAKVAAPNLSVPLRQLGSMTNYAEKMPQGLWAKEFIKGTLLPKETFDYMWKNNPWIETRLKKGYSEALADALEGANRMKIAKGSWTSLLTIPVRSFDITAIIYGGKPYFDSLTKKHGLKKARDIFEEFTLDTQQGRVTPSLSLAQGSRNPGTRLFFRFKNTTSQYLRRIVDDTIRHRRGEISTKQFAKTIGHYLILQSIMYNLLGRVAKYTIIGTGAALGYREWEEWRAEMKEDEIASGIMEQIATQPFQALPLLDGISSWAYRGLTKKEQYQAIQAPLIDDVNRALQTAQKEELTTRDYIKVLGAFAEPGISFPVGTLERYQRMITGGDKELPKVPSSSTPGRAPTLRRNKETRTREAPKLRRK